MVQKPVEQGGSADGGLIKVLAGHGRANNGENARANNRANTQRSQGPGTQALFERVSRLFRIPDELVDRLAGKQLGKQGSSPRPLSN